jgi:hypothetical protein
LLPSDPKIERKVAISTRFHPLIIKKFIDTRKPNEILNGRLFTFESVLWQRSCA